MWRSELSEAFWSGLVNLLLAAGLLCGAADVHALLHAAQRQAVGAGAHAGHDPQPIHLDGGSIDLGCPVCLFGFKNQSGSANAPGAIIQPPAKTRPAAAAATFEVGELPYRLPLSRAPPLS